MEASSTTTTTRKRPVERDCEALVSLLRNVRECIMSVRECSHRVLADGILHGQSLDMLQNSVARFMRCCLHMYNVVEEGLNYLDDVATTLPFVECTLKDADLLTAMVDTAPQELVHGSSMYMLHEPLSMLQSMLHTMRQEMASPSDRVFEQRMHDGGSLAVQQKVVRREQLEMRV